MKKLTGKEEIIMEFFWDRGELFVRELRELYQDPKPHINTLSTQVRTLDDEGMYGTFARLGTGGTPTFVLLDKDFMGWIYRRLDSGPNQIVTILLFCILAS